LDGCVGERVTDNSSLILSAGLGSMWMTVEVEIEKHADRSGKQVVSRTRARLSALQAAAVPNGVGVGKDD